MNWDIVVSLGYDPATVSDRVQMTTASGVEFAPRIVVNRIQAIGEERRAFPVVCHTLPDFENIRGQALMNAVLLRFFGALYDHNVWDLLPEA